METQWNIVSLSAEEMAQRDALASQLNISSVAASLFVRRGVTTAEAARAFIRPAAQPLHDPFLMRDMTEAEQRLSKAIDSGERILVYGDYDVDGTTAVALVQRFLSKLTPHTDFYIPDRYKEGYGISLQGIDYAAENGCTLVIALDCGIKAVDEIAYAAEKGIDCIVCDHHKPGERLPEAVAVLNPHRSDCPYPYKELSGCGVGFKLMQAYAERHDIPFSTLLPLLPLLAMSIASDIVPMTGENRTLACLGLQEMNRTRMPGLRALMKTAGIKQGNININDLAFRFGPRVNACGRIRSGKDAVRLLTTDDPQDAEKYAADVENNNRERQSLDKKISEQAAEQLCADPQNESKTATVVFSPDWNNGECKGKGVVGIVASRLIERWFRPTIVLTQDENTRLISGSARSVAGFDIYSAIDSCRDLLTNFGGHDYAAGLSMREENLEEFKRRFEEYVSSHITPEQQRPSIEVDAELSLSDITDDLRKVLQYMEPFGPGNPRPVFVTRGMINFQDSHPVGQNGEHLKLNLTDRSCDATGAMLYINGIAFRKGREFGTHLQNGYPVDVCYTLEIQKVNNRPTLQLRAEDIRKANQ